MCIQTKIATCITVTSRIRKKLLRFIAQTFSYTLLVSKVTLKRSHQSNRYYSRLV